MKRKRNEEEKEEGEEVDEEDKEAEEEGKRRKHTQNRWWVMGSTNRLNLLNHFFTVFYWPNGTAQNGGGPCTSLCWDW